MKVEVKEVAFVIKTGADRFGGVDDGPPADREDGINAVFARKPYEIANGFGIGVRTNAFFDEKLDSVEAKLLERAWKRHVWFMD